jgi:two-component system chemotaxis response regulator CheY
MKKIIIVSFPDKYVEKLISIVENNTDRTEVKKMYTYFQFFHSYKEGDADLIILDSFSNDTEMIKTGEKIKGLDPNVRIIGMAGGHNTSLKEEFISSVSDSGFILKNADNDTKIAKLIHSEPGSVNGEDKDLKQKGKTVLVVDDFENTLNVIKYTLEQAGFKVLTANNGQDALKMFKQNISPDIIVTDLNMPNMNGFELIENIRTIPGTDGIPIFILTTEFNFDKKLKARELNVSGWIQKPYSSDEFIRVISKVLD